MRQYEFSSLQNGREVTHGEDLEKSKLAEELFLFYDQVEREPESVENIYNNLLNGQVDKYIEDLWNYRDDFRGEISPGEILQINKLVGSAIRAGGNEWTIPPMNVALNEKEDHFRLVFINDYGDIQPLTDDIFPTGKDALRHAENIEGIKLITYSELERESRILQGNESLKNELNRITEAMKLAGWKLRNAHGQQTFWYREDHGEEIDFNTFRKAQNFLEDREPTDPAMEKEYNSLVWGEKKAEMIALAKDLDKAFRQYDNHGYGERIKSSIWTRERGAQKIYDVLEEGDVAPILNQLAAMKENEMINQEDFKSYQVFTERLETIFPRTEYMNGSDISHGEERGEFNKGSTKNAERDVQMEQKEKMNESQENLSPGPGEELKQKLRDGVKKTLDSEQFADWCKKQGKLYYNNYSFNNAFLTYIQKPEASYVCGYDAWKDYGRQVKQGARGIKIYTPVFAKEYKGKGSLFAGIKKACNEQLKKDSSLEYASYRLGQSKLSFDMYKNGLFDVKINGVVRMPHVPPEELRKFLDRSVIGKVPVYYSVATVFDIADTTDNVEYLWVSKDKCKKDEIVYDDNGNPISNKRGQLKIRNTEERKARFNADIEMNVGEQDTGKMEVLYKTLQKISNDKGIPMAEAEPSTDDRLAGGALGYYRHATEEYPNGNIVISNDLSLTDKVAVSFHEIAHSDMHRDLDKLKEEMGTGSGAKITREIKEVQAEAVAYMAASTFGIETEHKSFSYIANWSDGRELKALENSLNVIYKESRSLLQSIEKELDSKGYTMAIEPKNLTALTQEEKTPDVAEFKEFVLNNMRANEITQKSVFEDLKTLEEMKDNLGTLQEQAVSAEQAIVKEQVVLTRKIEEKLADLNSKVEDFEKSTDSLGQKELRLQMEARQKQIVALQDKVSCLSEERVAVVREYADKEKLDMKHLYAENPVKAMEQLKQEFPQQMGGMSEADLKFLAHSKFICREYAKYLGADNAKFVELASGQLDNFKEVLSKNKTAIEVSFCEQWGDEPIFEAGTIAHPKEANRIIAAAEQQTRDFKEQAAVKGDYYPYSKCNFTVYSFTGQGKLSVLNTRIDIGDGTQKDLTDHLTQICGRGKEKQELLENFAKSIRERSNIQSLTPKTRDILADPERDSGSHTKNFRTMDSWKDALGKETGIAGREKEHKQMIEKDDCEKE